MRNYSLTAILFLMASILGTAMLFRLERKPVLKAQSLITFPAYFKNTFFEARPVTESVEKILQSDFTQNGHYKLSGGKSLNVFTSAQSSVSTVDINAEIFQHTPDVCWVRSVWFKIPSDHEKQTIKVGGDYVTFQRRIYEANYHKVFCYFIFLMERRDIETENHPALNYWINYSTKSDIISSLRYHILELLGSLKRIVAGTSQTFGVA